jgi:hypothetical protein
LHLPGSAEESLLPNALWLNDLLCEYRTGLQELQFTSLPPYICPHCDVNVIIYHDVDSIVGALPKNMAIMPSMDAESSTRVIQSTVWRGGFMARGYKVVSDQLDNGVIEPVALHVGCANEVAKTLREAMEKEYRT